MDTRLYHYEYRRPRVNNPTYSSFNVNNSMTLFMGSPKNGTTYDEMNNSYRRSGYQAPPNPSNPNNEHRYRNDVQQYSPRYQQVQQQSMSSRGRAHSNLSSYGNNSLAFNQREIYNKQNSKFNIISLKPKQVPDRIKQYPKLTLEDKDIFYYEKMKTMREQQGNTRQLHENRQEHNGDNFVAGKHTYMPEQGKNPNGYQSGRYFTPKMLNHADQVSNIM